MSVCVCVSLLQAVNAAGVGKDVVLNPVSLQVPAPGGKAAPAGPSDDQVKFAATEACLHKMQRGQIFLGLVGARVTPKSSVRVSFV